MAMLRDLAETPPLILAVQGDELDLSLLDVRMEDLRSRSPVTERFCQDCRHLFDNWPDLSDTTVTHPDGTSCFPGTGANWKHAVVRSCHTVQLEAAARNGCLFDALLFQVLKDTQLLPLFRRIEARIELLGQSAEAHLSLQNWGRNSDQLIWLNWPGKVSTSCNAGIGAMQRIVSATLKSDALIYCEDRDVLNFTRRWLRDCDESQTDCNKVRVGALPGRLLYVGEDQVRLVSTAGWASGRHYTTLSHRWNADDFTMLLKENADALSIAVPEQALPGTFSDAIGITRKLGIDYIWIDSFCIIQDDEDDWHRETAIMEHIYGGSYLNIAASSATSVHGGCWVSNNGTHNAFRTKIRVGNDELVREIRDDDFYDRAVSSSHLATRAWALQEKLLSPRTLHLGDRGAVWECRSLIANEDLPDGFTQKLGSGLLSRTRNLQHLQQWWADVVRLFTKADLTQKGGQYLAGLWGDERIEGQLCWRVEKPRIRPTMWRAPSWSWASVDGPVSYAPTQSGISNSLAEFCTYHAQESFVDA
ncbi:hypothetical protein KC318_g3442 [Hortaea werneckii]|nr:hypothetical protein KC334_g3637 [Hortaea werneckii]KAI7017765.1 hypothetical protein KC355_g3565 [Hortaea werneckii]KAI7671517.1 hypothetical protein KC318_g3442 [Hortaea werneckii]